MTSNKQNYFQQNKSFLIFQLPSWLAPEPLISKTQMPHIQCPSFTERYHLCYNCLVSLLIICRFVFRLLERLINLLTELKDLVMVLHFCATTFQPLSKSAYHFQSTTLSPAPLSQHNHWYKFNPSPILVFFRYCFYSDDSGFVYSLILYSFPIWCEPSPLVKRKRENNRYLQFLKVCYESNARYNFC
jgi:hypothetical protein